MLQSLTFHIAQVIQVFFDDNQANLQHVVHGHAGKLLFGLLDRQRNPVVLLVGRVQSVNGWRQKSL